MTHDELLIRINKYCNDIISGQVWTTDVFIKALRAVVYLHHLDHGLPNEDVVCDFCKVVYPCHTIQAIEKELG